MPVFDFTSPDGKAYSVEGPEGATAAQAFEILQSQIGAAAKPADEGVGIGQDLAGVAKAAPGRLVAGLAGLPGDLYHAGLRALGDNLTPESAYGSGAINRAIGSEYQAQTTPGRIGQKTLDFAPGIIGGPGGLALKAATRVAAPVLASEAGRAVAGPYGELAGGLVGMGGGLLAERRLQDAIAAQRAAANPSADAIIKRAKEQFKSAEDMNLVVSPEFAANAAAKMRNDLKGFDPEAQSAVFKAADRLEGLAPPVAQPPSAPAAAGVSVSAKTASDTPPSLLEFIAAKGGLKPDPELEAIGLASGHRTQIPGQRGFFSVVNNRGDKIDRVREAAQEAGYLQGQNGATSTPRDLLDAIDAELRGQKRYPMGFEGSRTKRENLLMSEREKAAYDSHIGKFEKALEDAGHGMVSPDVKSRAINLMEREGMSADNAVEHALLQLDQEDAVGKFARAPTPPPSPNEFVHGFPPDMAKGVAMNDVELIRKQLSTLKTSPDASVREAARRAISSLQESQLAVTPAEIINGNAGSYAKSMREAIANYAAGKRSNTVMGKVALGDLNAATAGSGANEDNALRQAIKQLVRPVNNDIVPKASRLGFNKEEIDAMNRVARGSATGNAARYPGKLAPSGSVSGVLSGGAGFAAAGPMGAVALPAAGYLAKKIGDMSTKRAVAALDELVRARAPLARQVAAQLPPRIVQSLPLKTKLLLGAIAARPVVQPQLVPQGGK